MLGNMKLGGTSAVAFSLIIMATVPAGGVTVKINEAMASNDTTIADIDGDYSDWIELFNTSTEPVSLFVYGLSDDASEPFKWVFPDILLLPDSFLLVYASGKDRAIWPGELHTNFSIRAGGEELVLTAPNSAEEDLVDPVAMETDISYGRVPDGDESWWFFEEPTPGASNGSEPPPQRAPSPVFSPPAGFYPPGTTLTISCTEPSGIIRYTLDGSLPGDTSAIYVDPLTLDHVTVVRAISLVPGMLASRPSCGSYIVGYESTLPIVSLLTDPAHLWDEETGIYVEGPNAEDWPPHYGANYWQDWEIPIHFEFFEQDGTLGVSMDAGAKIFGGWSRCLPQKSLRIIARDRYGSDRITYQLFPDESITSFKSIILRNSGDEWDSTMMRDALMTGLMHGSGVASQAYQPMVVFLNGEYWGIHNLRERLDEFYLASHYAVDKDSVDIIEMGYYTYDATEGDSLAYVALLEYLENHDTSEPSVYDSLQTLMDVENFIRYQAAEIYYANTDWPGINNRCWRAKRQDARFQWLLYDTDCGFGSGWWGSWYDHNTVEFATVEESDYWANDSYATFLFRRLLENDLFRTAFIVRICDLMNSFFPYEHALARINAIHDEIADEMLNHIARWYPDHDWEGEIEVLREFARLRKGYVMEHLRGKFDLAEPVSLTIDRPGEPGGRVRVNAFLVDTFPWGGDYFSGLPLLLRAEPFTGYQFAGWEGDLVAGEDSVTFIPYSDSEIRAVFEHADQSEPAVVITEINYHSADDFDPGDWVELYALHGNHDLGGWVLRDEQNAHQYVIPWGAMLREGDYLILAADQQSFTTLFPDVSPVRGDLGFNLGNGGDQVRLYDCSNALVDSVEYDDEPPWPVEPDGHGATLQLLNPSFANEFFHNWRGSLVPHGDPGEGYLPVMTLTGNCLSGDLFLTWSAWPEAAEYWIYGANNEPYFAPRVTFPYDYKLLVLPSGATSWSSSDGVGDPESHWSYLVIAMDEEHQELMRSNRVGERDALLDISPAPSIIPVKD